MTPQQYVQDKAAGSGSSFYYAFRFLPRPRREAITAFYAFCREVDDVVDEMRDPGVAAAKLDWWSGEVRAAFGGRPSHPVTIALMPGVARQPGFDAWLQMSVAAIRGMVVTTMGVDDVADEWQMLRQQLLDSAGELLGQESA